MQGQQQPGDPRPAGISGWLRAWSGGNQSALKKLTALAYEEPHGLARHARRQNQTRCFGVVHVPLEESVADLAALDDAVNALARLDARKSPVTVVRDWSTAKAWLYRERSGAARAR